MKNLSPALTLGAALLLAPFVPIQAQPTWKTAADFECALPAAVDALAKDAAGNYYAAVSTTDAQSRMHALIHKSADQGATWTVIEDFVSAPWGTARFVSLGADPTGHLYAAGFITDDNGHTRWLVRQSGQGGGSWSTVDDFAYPLGHDTTAQGVTIDAAGNLYVAGYGEESPAEGKTVSRLHWLVRQSHDGGHSWATIDDFGFSFSARAAAILNTPGGLLVAGSGWNGKSESGERWLVRKGTADGAGGFRWQTVDEFQMKENGHGFDSRVQGLGVDTEGNLYAVGRSATAATDGSGGRSISTHWVVRRASGAGSDWKTADTFQLEPGSFATACGIAGSGHGSVMVAGRAVGKHSVHWIVRKSATGETGSWSVGDDFEGLVQTPSDVAAAAAGRITVLADGSTQSSPAPFASGLAVLCDSTHVLAGGLAVDRAGHAIVRSLELGRASELAATKASAAP